MLLLCPGLAHAQPASGDSSELREVYKKGKEAFDLGNFEEAIKYFKQAYAMQPHESHLYNIAQAYRQSDDCRNALFFYKRYLAVGGAQARHYEAAQRRIKELTSSCKATDDKRESLESDQAQNGGGGEDGTGGEGGDDGTAEGKGQDRGGGERSAALKAEPGASLLAASLELGGAVLDIGTLDISGAQFSLGLGAGYPLTFGKLGLTLGGLFTCTPVPWANENTGQNGTSTLIGLVANIGARYSMAEKLAVRFELGLGVLLLSGLTQGNVFLPEGTMATGALGMSNVRLGVGAEYLLTDNLVLSASPFVYSFSPAKEVLRAEIDNLVRIDFIAGLGYRM